MCVCVFVCVSIIIIKWKTPGSSTSLLNNHFICLLVFFGVFFTEANGVHSD